MPTLLLFLLKVNIALLLFCAGYYLVLRHLTFYTLNRIYLIVAILFASVYPQINLAGFAQRHQQISDPVREIVYHLQTPAETLIKPFAQPNYWHWAEVAFWLGAGLLATRLLVQLYSLYKLYRNSTATNVFGHNIRVVNGDVAPFSFWKSIYVNPANHELSDLKSILLHEQVHVNDWHTLDILLAELSTIFYWFNPGVWLMKKAVRENIEFITDRKILKQGTDTKQYQYSLLSVSFSSTSPTIVNHFNISTIKKRIIMMNAKRSSKFKLTRYALLVPIVVALLLVFSMSKASFIKKSGIAFKAIVTNVKKLERTVKPPATELTPTTESNKAKPTNLVITKSTLDTLQKGNLIGTKYDSLSYVINGIKATKADFKAIDPDHIYAVDIVSAKIAGKALGRTDITNSVLFVTTNDSESGKKFKQKLDNVSRDRVVLWDTKPIKPRSADGIIINGHALTYTNNVDSIRINGRNMVYTTPTTIYNYRIDSNKRMGSGLVYYDRPMKMDSINRGGKRMYYGRPMKMDSLKIKKGLKTINGQTFYSYGLDSVRIMQPNTVNVTSSNLFFSRGNRQTTISGIQTKMILIDGKEASEKAMKKLPASEIESLSVKTGDEVTKKYGEKAKNGVVFITTKKAN